VNSQVDFRPRSTLCSPHGDHMDLINVATLPGRGETAVESEASCSCNIMGVDAERGRERIRVKGAVKVTAG
jgi:hypothetical protein